MAKEINPLIIIILIIGGIFIYNMGIKTSLQATQELEPVRGQLIYEEFGMIPPCFKATDIEVGEYKGYPKGENYVWAFEYAEYKLKRKPMCVFLVESTISGQPEISNGELYMYSEYRHRTHFITDLDIKNTDVSVYYTLDNALLGLLVGEEQFITDTESGTGVLKLTHSFLNPNIVRINIGGREFQKTLGVDDVYFGFFAYKTGVPGNIRIDEIRYSKPFTFCITDETETIYVDRFAPNSIIRWSEPRTFDYAPLRFCYDTPTWKFVDGKFFGTDYERAELTRKLSEGEEHTVGSNEEFWVFYVTPFVENMGQKCEIGEAKDRDGNCVKTRYEEPITIFQCETKIDCPVPPSCDPETVVCNEDNLCEYVGVECKGEVIIRQEIIKEIVEKTIPVFITQKEFIFTSWQENEEGKTSFMVGDKKIEQTPFIDFDEPYLNRIECPVLNIRNKTIWNMQCKYEIDTSFLKITAIDGFKQVLLNSDGTFNIEISNDYVNFNDEQGGFIFDCFRIIGLQEDLRSTIINNGFFIGKNKYDFEVYDNLLGEYICDLTPYIKVIADKENTFLAKERRLFTYLVVDEVIDFGKIEEIEALEVKEEEPITEKFKLREIPGVVWIIGIILILWRLIK